MCQLHSDNLLEIIHTDIFCGHFPNPTLNSVKYFISLNGDLSHYAYVFLIPNKSCALDVFKIHKTKSENQLEKKIKVVRSDRIGEYCGTYDEEDGQIMEAFANITRVWNSSLVYNLIMPEHNGVAERLNKLL